MSLYRCQSCGGDLTEQKDGLFRCVCCDNIQSFDKANGNQPINESLSADAVDNIYKSATKAMANQRYAEAINLFMSIQGYLDSDEKSTHCQNMLLEKNNSDIYNSACVTLASAKTSDNYRAAASMFNQIPDYRDSRTLMCKCLSKAELLKNEELYTQACELMGAQSIHFLERAVAIFDSIPDFGDSTEKKKECIALIEQQQKEILKRNAELKAKNDAAAKKRKITIFSVLGAIVALIVIIVSVNKAMHSVGSIDVSIIGMSSKSDNKYYYVYTDYKITNGTAKDIDYIEVVTYVSDKNGRSLGTITSTFGSSYGGTSLNLKAKESTVQQKYMSEYQSNYMDSLFVALYNNGIDDFVVSHEITEVTWSDGYSYSK